MIDAPYPDLDELLTLIGEAGHRLSEIDASEGAAGNISVYLGWEIASRASPFACRAYVDRVRLGPPPA
jgi:hypothetical protein